MMQLNILVLTLPTLMMVSPKNKIIYYSEVIFRFLLREDLLRINFLDYLFVN